MGIYLVDLADADRELKVNYWNWGAVIRIIEHTGMIGPERIRMMDDRQLGIEVSKKESRGIAAHLRERVANMQPGERVRWDLSTTADPDNGAFHEEPREDYSALYDVLNDVSQFLDECDGFWVSYG